MTKAEQDLWSRAYKTAHVAADITEKAIGKGKFDAQWLLDEARELNCIAQALAGRAHGEKVESIAP